MGGHGNEAHAGLPANETRHLHAVHLGHLDVDETHGGWRLPYLLNGLSHIAISGDAPTGGRQAAHHFGHQLPLQLVVVEDEKV